MTDSEQNVISATKIRSSDATSIDVLMCTFRRPAVTHALDSIEKQELPVDTSVRVIVADNDHQPTAKALIEARARSFRFPLKYVHAPAANICIARNACLDNADADWIAFIDDDEVAEPNWLAELLKQAYATNADAVFGPSYAVYEPGTPEWMRVQDHHSSVPLRKGKIVETGHTGNVMMRWRDSPARRLRFNQSRGRFQGEDVEYFFKLRHAGGHLEIAENAIVREPVPSSRLTLEWIKRRKFGAGYSYALGSETVFGRARLTVMSSFKALVCLSVSALIFASPGTKNYWLVRGMFHAGTLYGCLRVGETIRYGE